MNNFIDELERNVIGVLIKDCNKIKECEIEPKHFINGVNAKIFECLLETYDKNGTLDIVIMSSEHEYVRNHLDYVMRIIESIATISHFEYYVDLIKKDYITRETKKIYQNFISNKIDEDERDYQLKLLDDEFEEKSVSTMKSKKEIFEMITMQEETIEMNRFKEMQRKINFIQNVVYVIGARPSVGKSAFGLNIMNDVSDNYNCIFLNMEMKESELYQRLVSINSQVPIEEFKCLTEFTLKKVMDAIDIVIKKNIKIYNGAKSTKGIRKILKKQCKDKNKHTIIFVDHIGYVSISGKDYLDDKSRIGNAMKELQIMTKEFNCTMFVMSQINRAGTDEPKVEYLKDSGQIEEVAHGILLLHDEQKDYNNQNPIYKLICAKNRSGKKGKYGMCFHKNTQTTDDLQDLEYDD